MQGDQISNCDYGLYLIYTHDDIGTDLSLSDNVIGLHAQNAVDEVFTNLTISNSDSLDISLVNNSRIFVQNSTFDASMVNVQEKSALFTGDDYEVTITSTTDGLPTAFTQLTIFNQSNDTLSTPGDFISDSEGQFVIKLSDMGITESNSGSAAINQNPWTFVSSVQLNGDLLSGSLTATLTSDTSLTIELSTDNENLLTFLPDTLTEPGKYYLVPGAAYQIDTTGAGFIRAALWIAGQDTDSYNQNVPGVDDVYIDGQDATIIGYGPEATQAAEFGVWFQNDLRALDPALRDTTYRDTCVNVMVERFKYGVVFRQIADGLIDNCTIDSTQKGIELMSSAYNVRNTITNNLITNSSDKGISVRGSANLMEDNTITNEKDSANYGIQIDRNYSFGNKIIGNTISGGLQAAIRFNAAYSNVTSQNILTDAFRGIYVSGSSSRNNHDNLMQGDQISNCDLMQGDQISNCDVGIYLIYSRDDKIIGATLTDNKIGLLGSYASGTVFENTDISSSDSMDVIAENNTVLFLDNCSFDTSKVMVQDGSVVYVSKRNDVDIKVTLNGQALTSAADVTVTNTDGDTMAVFLTDTTGAAQVAVGEWAIISDTPAGTVDEQNPFTFDAALEDGFSQVTVAVTSDTSVILDIIVDAIDGDLGNLPKTYALQQNFPNPFNPVTTIKYQLPKASDVLLKIYNILGQSVITLINERQEAGYKSIIWNGLNESGMKVSTGIYFYVMEAGNFRSIKKMMLLK
jgi:flagellar hook assembly protein FlgD